MRYSFSEWVESEVRSYREHLQQLDGEGLVSEYHRQDGAGVAYLDGSTIVTEEKPPRPMRTATRSITEMTEQEREEFERELSALDSDAPAAGFDAGPPPQGYGSPPERKNAICEMLDAFGVTYVEVVYFASQSSEPGLEQVHASSDGRGVELPTEAREALVTFIFDSVAYAPRADFRAGGWVRLDVPARKVRFHLYELVFREGVFDWME